MRRLTFPIAAVVLSLMPSSAWACYEHEAGWFDEMPTRSWQVPRNSAEGFRWEEALGAWIVAAGSASLALAAVTIRAVCRTTGRDRLHPLDLVDPAPLALPFDWPSDRTIRVDQGHEPLGPNVVIREDGDSPGVSESPADWIASDCLAASIS